MLKNKIQADDAASNTASKQQLNKCLCEVAMKNNYLHFIELSLLQCTKNDYSDKLKVKAHNQALGKLSILKEKMKENLDLDEMKVLLEHSDERVVINAASFCLEIGAHKDKSCIVLKKIIEASKDETFVFAARNVLNSQ